MSGGDLFYWPSFREAHLLFSAQSEKSASFPQINTIKTLAVVGLAVFRPGRSFAEAGRGKWVIGRSSAMKSKGFSMSTKKNVMALWAIVTAGLLAGSGCTSLGPNLGPLAFPIPVSPYFQKKQEDQHWVKERYGRVPVLGPLTADTPPLAMDEPSDDEVMRAFEKARPSEGGIPLLHTVQRKNVRIMKKPIDGSVDPPRFYPLIGPAQLHHSRWKCIIFYSQVNWAGWPVPHRTIDEDASEVIYIDRSHFHMVGNVDTGKGTNF